MSRVVDEAERAGGKTQCYGYGAKERLCVNEALPDRPWCASCDKERKTSIDAKLHDIESSFDAIFERMEKSR